MRSLQCMPFRLSVAALLFSMSFLVSASAKPEEIPETGTISGSVLDENGTPLPQVAVILKGMQVGCLTDSTGTFTMQGITTGTYTLSAHKTGYLRSRISDVHVRARQTSIVQFTIVQFTMVAGPERAAADSERVAPCPSPGLDTKLWARIEQKHFTFSIPPDFIEEKVQGIDSWIRSFRAADSSVVFDFDWGGYSDPLARAYEDFQNFEACGEEIGGRKARIVTICSYGPRPSPNEASFRYAAGVAWREIEPRLHLTIFGWARERKGLDQLLQVYRTVEFE